MICVVPWCLRMLLYALFNHPRRYSRFSGYRNLSSRITLTGLFRRFSWVNSVRCVCHSDVVMRGADANETSGQLGQYSQGALW